MTHPHSPYNEDPGRKFTIILLIAVVVSLAMALHEIFK